MRRLAPSQLMAFADHVYAASEPEPKRGADYQVYPPSATSDRKGWAVTIGGHYVKTEPFASRDEAEQWARLECLRRLTSERVEDTMTTEDRKEQFEEQDSESRYSLRDEGRNPDGTGESYASRNT